MKNSNSHWTDSVYQEVTDKLIAQLAAGTVPWRKPWATGCVPASNLVSKKAYRGINAIVLGFSDYASPYWLTFNQARQLGGSVRKGEKSTLVVYYKLLLKKDASGRPVFDDNGRQKGFPMLRYSRVFNLEQVEGIADPSATNEAVEQTPGADAEHLEAARQVASDWQDCPVEIIGTQACYSPSLDKIRMPAISTFRTEASYFHTLFHEMGHATGHASRLSRDGVTSATARFGSEVYSKEELVAELTASFVSNITGILGQVEFEQSAAYLANWLTALKGDHKLVIAAASAAQKAADHILKRGDAQEDESK